MYLRDGCAQTVVGAATLRFQLQIQLAVSCSQYTDTRPTSPSADPRTPGTWQGLHCSADVYVAGMARRLTKTPRRERGWNPCVPLWGRTP